MSRVGNISIFSYEMSLLPKEMFPFVSLHVRTTHEHWTGFLHASLTLLSCQCFLTDSEQKEDCSILENRNKVQKQHPQSSEATWKVTCFALSWFNLLSLQRNIKDAVL
jgi:hypothetical protein